jgi:hypothetical protein
LPIVTPVRICTPAPIQTSCLIPSRQGCDEDAVEHADRRHPLNIGFKCSRIK